MPGPLEETLRFLGTHADLWAYGIIFLAAATEMVFPPFPGDVVYLSGMVLAGGGALDWLVVLTLSCVGGIGGAWILYEFGHWKGRGWFSRAERWFFNPRTLAEFDRLFAKYGSGLVIISRFMPGFRSAIPLATGIAQITRVKAFLLLSLSVMLWNGALAGVGLLFGRNWHAVTDFLIMYNRIVIGAIILAAAIYGIIVYKNMRRRNKDQTS